LIVSILAVPGQTVYAQISLPAEINKSFSPISIEAGGTSRLRVTIFNPNSFQLTNASWSDNLIGVQPGLTIATPVGLTNTCSGSVNATAGGTTLSLSGGTVPAQAGPTPGSCTVSINVTSTTPGNLINTIPAGALSSTGGGVSISNTTPASATLNVTGSPVPGVSKSFSPGTIWAGRISELSIVITNNEPGRSLTQVSLTDTLPAGVFLADPPNASTSGCGASASVTALGGGTSVALSNGTIAPSSSCIIRVSVTSDTQGRYTNRIPANALGTQQGVTNATPATARLTVEEIGLTKRFSPPRFSDDETTTLIITLQNPTSTPHTGVDFTDTLPPPLTAVGVIANSCNGTVSITPPTAVSLTGGIIPAGSPTSIGTCTISIEVAVPLGTGAGTLRNTIPAGELTTDQGIGNLRPANANVTITGTNMSGTKTFSPATIAAGAISRLRIQIEAPDDTNLTNFSITDSLPAGVFVADLPNESTSGCGAEPPLVFTPAPGATSISLTNGLILAGDRCQIDVYVTSSTAGVHTNTIPPGNITNNEDRRPAASLSANLTVTGGSTLAIEVVKGFEPLTVFGGSASTMSIELINPGTATLTGIAFTDNMPNGMILAAPVNFNVGTCGGTLSGVPGANSFSFNGGRLPSLGRCTLTLSATMTVNGNLTNRIPAGAVTTTNGVSNADPVEATLTNLPGASVSKFFSPNPISAGAQSLLTIIILNTGNIELTGMGLSDSLPAGLVIAGGSAPAPVNNCGGTFVAIAGTQLIQLTGGSLAGNSSCTMVVAVTGSNPGDYVNTIPAGALITDPSVGATNGEPAIDTLTITGTSSGGGGGGGRGGGNNNSVTTATTTGAFLIPVTGFAPGRVTKLDSSSHPVYDATSLAIEIPVLKVNTSIVGVASKNGNWDVSWLRDQVGWLNGTAYPTWKGNSLLTAHVVNADGKPGVFSKLKALGTGEFIYVYNSGYRYTYQVVSNAYVLPNDNTVVKHEEKSYLTLITCDTYDEKTGTYLRRVAVRAVLVDVRAIK
jgi:LPXTG-site transpeptidase (sortase) family protein